MIRIKNACLEQTILFEAMEDYENYKARMDKRRIPYLIVTETKAEDGSVVVQLKKRYNHYDTGDYLK